MVDGKIPAYVLCKSILHNAFRSHAFKHDGDKPKPSGDFKLFVGSRFIFATAVELAADPSRYYERAFSTRACYDDFQKHLDQDLYWRLYVKLSVAENAIVFDRRPDLNHLPLNLGIITLAEVLFNEGKEPYLITSMKEKMIQDAQKYYTECRSDPTIPFEIISLEEAVKRLSEKYPEIKEDLCARDIKYRGLF